MMSNMCLSRHDLEMRQRNQFIEEYLAEEAVETRGHIKILLLGAGGCGKTTIIKQMKILHKNGFTEQEVEHERAAVYSNTVTAMHILLTAMHKLDITLDSTDREVASRIVMNAMHNNEQSEPFSAELKDALKDLWSDYGVREAYERRAEFQLFDAANYFFEAIDRIAEEDYRPTEQDILYVRVKTIGIVEVTFNIKNLHFRVFDVGGQRSERRKWIHCFDDVGTIIFITAISEYNQTLEEDETTNRLIESLNLFDAICNSQWFGNTSMILFLNKKDLFEEKLGNVPLSACFPDYPGSSEAKDYDKAVAFIQQKFEALNLNVTKTIYTHQTCATDTNQVQIVLETVLDLIIAQNVHGCGLA